MKRLTHQRVNGIKTGYWSPAKKEELVQRLAAYEDTGLEPEEIMAARSETDKITAEMMSHICDELCRHPRYALDQEELDESCANCRLNGFICRIRNTYTRREAADDRK